MCGKGSSGGGGFGGLAPAQQQTVQASPQALGWYSQAMNLAQQAVSRPYQQFGTKPEDFVAQLNPQQQQAMSGLGGLAESTQPYAALAPQMAAQAGMGNAAQMSGAYMNPYMQQVVQPVQQALQQQQGQQLAQQQAEAIKSGAFGGQRDAITRATLMGQQQLGMGQALSPLYQTGYGQALQAAQTDLARQLQAAQGLQSAGAAAQQASLGAGTLGQQTQQAGINALYNQFQQQQMFPYMQAQFFGGLAGGLGPLLGQTTYQSQAVSPFGMFLSDPRAKTGVDREEPDVVGKLNDGQNVYAYRYADGGPAQIGLMADEVARRHPDAVGLRPDGLMAVDYGRATEDSARMGGAVRNGGDYARGGYAEGGLTAGELGQILAAHEAMYSNWAPKQASIPTEGIRAATPLTPGVLAPGEKPKSGLETMEAALGMGEKLSSLLGKGYDLYTGYKDKQALKSNPQEYTPAYETNTYRASGGIVPANQGDDLWRGITGNIQTSQGLKAANLNDAESPEKRRSDSILDKAGDFLGTAGKIGGGLAGLYSAATTLGPALMALSDPRAKTGVRPGYADGRRVYSDEDIDYYLRPLAKGESGGERDPYRALGPATKYGQALGKYQILESNLPQWGREAGLGNVTREQFLANPEIQEKMARHRFGSYLLQTGRPEEAAAMWFAGPGYKKKMGAKDVLGTSVPEYMSRYERNLQGGLDPVLASLGPRERSFMASASPQPPSRPGTPPPAPTGVVPPGEDATPKSLGDVLTSKEVMVPLLTGLGTGITTMVGTPTRNLGTALLAGAGAGLASGAKSYMETAKAIPEIRKMTAEAATQEAETKAREQLVKKMGYETYQEYMKAVASSTYKNAAGVPMVRLSDGSEVPYYIYSQDPSKYPRPASSAIQSPSVAEAAAGVAPPAGSAPSTGGAPATGGAPPIRPLLPQGAGVTAPVGIVYDPRSKSSARTEFGIIGTPGEEAARKRSETYRSTVDQNAEGAQAQKLLLNDVGGIISEAVHATGAGTPGAGGTTRAMIVNYGNTIARGLGYGEDYFGASDSSAALLSKLNTLAGQRGVEAAQQTALGSLAKLVDAQPNLDQPPKASLFNAASNMVNNQMKIDQRDHADVYGQDSGGLYGRAGVDFKRTHTPLKYRKEQEAIMKAMWEDPEAFKGIISGLVDAEYIEQYFKDPKHGGIKGMSRYFGG